MKAKPNTTTKPGSLSSSAIVRAFRIDVDGWPDATSIVLTTSAARARYDGWSASRDAGYGLGFSRFKVRRAPEFDRKRLVTRRCYGIAYARAAEDCPNRDYLEQLSR